MAARTKARKRALDLLFESEQRGVNVAELLGARITTPVTPAPLPEYTRTLVTGVVSNWARINDLLTTYSQGWPMERMAAVDRAILRIGTWEILEAQDVPDAVVIAEAVALAKDLSTDDSPRFINGLLARIAEVKATLV